MRPSIIHFLICFLNFFHFLGHTGPKMSILDPKQVHLDHKVGPIHFKNISISTGLKSWARTPSIIHVFICFLDIFHFLGHMGPKMPILNPKQVHLDPKIGQTHFKNISISMGSKNWVRRPSIVHFTAWESFQIASSFPVHLNDPPPPKKKLVASNFMV